MWQRKVAEEGGRGRWQKKVAEEGRWVQGYFMKYLARQTGGRLMNTSGRRVGKRAHTA